MQHAAARADGDGAGAYLPEVRVDLSPEATPARNGWRSLWGATRRDLSAQVTRATFDTLSRGTRLVWVEGDRYEIAVAEARQVAWLEHRLKRVVVAALEGRMGQKVRGRLWREGVGVAEWNDANMLVRVQSGGIADPARKECPLSTRWLFLAMTTT